MLYLSQRIDCLADFLADRLVSRKADPFLEKWILLPSQINKQWLMGALAERMDGRALACVKALSWRDALLQISRKFGHPIPNDLDLRLAITGIFERKSLPPSFAPLTDWLDQQKGSSTRLEKLVRLLACRVSEAGFYGLAAEKGWQKDLCRMLSEEGPWRFPDQLLRDARFPASVAEVHCFCIDEMPGSAWDFLLRQGDLVSIYQFSPCQMFWEDIYSDRERRRLSLKMQKTKSVSFEEFEVYLKDTHPLLANWGRIGRQTLRRLENLERVEAYEDAQRETLLSMVQSDLLSLRTLKEEPCRRLAAVDDSIQIIAAGSSKLRELQILRDQLLSYFERTQADPSEVLVLAPDIKLYESLIHFVFGADLPLRIAPVAQLSSNAFAQGFLLFLELAEGRWDADRVLELFENRSFMTKQGLKGEDLDQYRGWMRDAKVRGGWDGKKGNWADGLKRMVLGLAFLLPKEAGLQIRNLDWGQADKLEQFLQLIQQVRERTSEFRSSEKRTLESWSDLLNQAARAFFKPQDGEDALMHKFLSKLLSAATHFPQERFSFSILKSLFQDSCQDEASTYQAHLWQSVQFASLQPGSIRPAKAIFLLGMDSETFPRKKSVSSFDWPSTMPEKPEIDRYLLLQTIFAAEEQLSISYCHISGDDGKVVEMALPLQEFLQMLDLFYPIESGKTSDALVVAHPALPFDRRYFDPKSRVHSFSQQAYQAIVKLPDVKPFYFWPHVAIPNLEKRVQFDLKNLLDCAKNPWKYFLTKKLGIYLQEESLFSEMRTKDFDLPVYTRRELLLMSLKKPIEVILAKHAHQLPPGVFGDGERAKLEEKSKKWKSHLEKWTIRPDEVVSIRFSPHCTSERILESGWIEAPPVRVRLSEDREIEIVGELTGVAPSGLLLENSDAKATRALRHWPVFLVYLLHSKQSRAALYSLDKGEGPIWELDASSALRRWLEYAFRAEESLSPLIKPWGETFLQKNFEEWSKKVRSSPLEDEQDRWLRWVTKRAAPLPLERIWEEWSSFTRETFAELLEQ
jgi:exodeoxyribonuclease V gamma subunit